MANPGIGEFLARIGSGLSTGAGQIGAGLRQKRLDEEEAKERAAMLQSRDIADAISRLNLKRGENEMQREERLRTIAPSLLSGTIWSKSAPYLGAQDIIGALGTMQAQEYGTGMQERGFKHADESQERGFRHEKELLDMRSKYIPPESPIEKIREERRSKAMVAQQKAQYVSATQPLLRQAFSIKNIDRIISEKNNGAGIYGSVDNIEGVGFGAKHWRDWIQSKEGTEIRAYLRSLLLGTGKKESGAAIREDEWPKFEQMLGLGARDNVNAFLNSIRALNDQLLIEYNNREAALSPEVYDEVMNDPKMWTSKNLPKPIPESVISDALTALKDPEASEEDKAQARAVLARAGVKHE